MTKLFKRTKSNLVERLGIAGPVLLIFVALTAVGVLALNRVGQAAESRLVQIYVDGENRTISTNAGSVREILQEAEVEVGPLDLTEPSLNAKVEGESFHINIFRASPFMVIDGAKHFVVNSPHRSPLLIAKSAGLNVYPEDKISVELANDFVTDQFIGKKLIIDRATPVTVEMDGHVFSVRTHSHTVRELLDETGIELTGEDFTTLSPDTALSPGQRIGVVRVGHEVVTEEETLPFTTRTIADHSLPLGTRKVIQEGTPGRKLYTYEVKRHNGIEVERRLASVTEFSDPIPEIVARGTSIPDTYTSNEQILAALRECETHSNYRANTGNGFYGAYQFMIDTWDRVAPRAPNPRPDLVSVRPDRASENDQDFMVLKNARLSQGGFWSQHPGCSKYLGLPQFPF